MLQDLKVGTRLLGAFLLVALLGGTVAGIGIVNMATMNRQAELAYANDLLGISASKQANIHLIDIGRCLGAVLVAANASDKQLFTGLVRKARLALRDSLARARPLYVTPAGRALFTEVDRSVSEFDILLGRLLELAEDETPDGKAAAVKYAFTTFAIKSNAVDGKLSELAVHKELAAAAGAAMSSQHYAQSRTLMLVLVLSMLAISVVLGVWITRKLTRQLGGEPAYAVAIAEAIARGDLTMTIATHSGDTSSLLHAMESMRAALVRIVGQVRSGTDAIATASNQIAASNLDLSTRTEQQAGSLGESASAIDLLTCTVRQNAGNAREANVMASSASAVALRGGNVVAEVVTTMASISASSRKIIDIISVIDGIAFQTNILALNAAVEAARAGEQGRGFAVVASEVRNLAQRSAAAAREIKHLISDSVERVEAGGRLVDQAGLTMSEIVRSITEVSDVMGAIASASNEQMAGIEQVSAAITQMDEVTQQNAALVEEAAAAAGSLQEQAAAVAEVVRIFKLATAKDGSKFPLAIAVPPDAPGRGMEPVARLRILRAVNSAPANRP